MNFNLTQKQDNESCQVKITEKNSHFAKISQTSTSINYIYVEIDASSLSALLANLPHIETGAGEWSDYF